MSASPLRSYRSPVTDDDCLTELRKITLAEFLAALEASAPAPWMQDLVHTQPVEPMSITTGMRAGRPWPVLSALWRRVGVPGRPDRSLRVLLTLLPGESQYAVRFLPGPLTE